VHRSPIARNRIESAPPPLPGTRHRGHAVPRVKPRAAPGLRNGSAVLPACLGFAAGAIFWHLVGFWQFIGEVVLDRPDELRAELAAMGTLPRAAAPPIVTGSIADGNCVRLTLDRTIGAVATEPCRAGAIETGVSMLDALPRGDLSTALDPPEVADEQKPD
jgi:hypothetical protein